jgi:hypothetical protein
MAPRRGGGGGGSGGGGWSSTSCPEPFSRGYYDEYTNYVIANFASYCIFFAATLGILIAFFCVKKRHGNARRLAGPFYQASLWFNLLYAPNPPPCSQVALLTIAPAHTPSSS